MTAPIDGSCETGPCREDAAGPAAPWWKRLPTRLESELRELEELGVRYERDPRAEAAGVLRLLLQVPYDGQVLPLVATFPDSYPFFAVQVEAPTLDLPHHQHPFGKALCLLPRSTWWWNPATDGLARLLRERLGLVLRAGTTTDAAGAADIEEHAPEPFSDYYAYENDSIVLIAAGDDGRLRVRPEATAGVVVIGIEGAAVGGRPQPRLRGALLEVRDDAGAILLRAPEALVRRYAVRVEGRWSRLVAPVRGVPLADAAATVYAAAENADGPSVRPREYDTQQAGVRLRIRAALFPEERRWRGEQDSVGDGWAFAVRLQGVGNSRGGNRSKGARQLRGAPAGSAATKPTYYLARPGRYAPGDLAARAPELRPLRAHTVAVFGLGCLGAPSAFEFARASVGGLRLLDHDVIDPATTMRWPLGIMVAGGQKAPVLAQILEAQYPYVSIAAEVHHIGAPRPAGPDGLPLDEPEAAVLTRMLDGASLLYDATAEWGVQRFLAGLARDRSLPYVGVQGTPGGWGGVVVRIVPGVTEGCWMCLQHWRSEPSSSGIPAPPHDVENGDIHPEGCADPTYAGANMDLAEVAIMGVRMAIGTLAGNKPGGYPSGAWDVAVLALRTEAGDAIPPTWTTHSLRRHPACTECAARDSAKIGGDLRDEDSSRSIFAGT